MKKPSIIKVGHADYTIAFSSFKERTDIDGRQDGMNQYIQIQTGLPAQREAYVLLHEVFHAIYAEFGLLEGDLSEERVVDGLSRGFATFVRDNPDFLVWLKSRLKLKPKPC